MNQKENEQNEVDGMKKRVDSTGIGLKVMHIQKYGVRLRKIVVYRELHLVKFRVHNRGSDSRPTGCFRIE